MVASVGSKPARTPSESAKGISESAKAVRRCTPASPGKSSNRSAPARGEKTISESKGACTCGLRSARDPVEAGGAHRPDQHRQRVVLPVARLEATPPPAVHHHQLASAVHRAVDQHAVDDPPEEAARTAERLDDDGVV